MANKKPEKETVSKDTKSDKLEKLMEVLLEKEISREESLAKEKEEEEKANQRLSVIVKGKKEQTRKRLAEAKMVNIRLQSTSDMITNIVEIRDPENSKKTIKYDSYGEPKKVTLSGYTFYVPRGVSCFVPEEISDVINNSEKVKRAASDKVHQMQRERAKLYQNK